MEWTLVNIDLNFEQQSEVVTGKESTLTLKVTNDGADILEDVRLEFNNDNVRLKDKNELVFGDLDPGASATASAIVFAEDLGLLCPAI